MKFNAFKHKMMMYYPSVVASKKANGLLYKQLLAQARLGAFFDIFTLMALLSLSAILIILLLKNKQKCKTKNA